jgi:ribosomal protein S18 acetylase RimI-like enzyme
MRTRIRAASGADVEAVAALVDRAYRVYVPRIGRRPAPMDWDYVALVEAGKVSVLLDDGAIAGIIVLRLERDHLLVENVAVDPARQGEGLGRRLLTFAEEEARRHGLDEVRLYTNVAMTENIAMYRRLGWEEHDRRTGEGFARVHFRKAVGDDRRARG